MKLGRILGVGLSAVLAAGALTAAPTVQVPNAQAAVAAPVIHAAVKAPRIDYRLWDTGQWGKYGAMFPTKTVALGKTASFKVKASGGQLKYQWWVRPLNGGKGRKVSGAAGKRAVLKVKVSSKSVGKLYSVTVRNSKGSTTSGYFYLQAKRGSVSQVKVGNAGLVGKFRVAPLGKATLYSEPGKVAFDVFMQNVSKKAAAPASTLRFAYRAPNGKLYLNENTERYSHGTDRLGTVKAGQYSVQLRLKATVPSSDRGGAWVVWSSSKPSHKMKLK